MDWSKTVLNQDLYGGTDSQGSQGPTMNTSNVDVAAIMGMCICVFFFWSSKRPNIDAARRYVFAIRDGGAETYKRDAIA